MLAFLYAFLDLFANDLSYNSPGVIGTRSCICFFSPSALASLYKSAPIETKPLKVLHVWDLFQSDWGACWWWGGTEMSG